MNDVERIKARIDCRELIEHDLGKPKYRHQRYNIYKCPLHRETRGFSLVVYDNHWQCFGKCNRGGDAIAWLQEYHHLSFREACEQLASGDLPQVASSQCNHYSCIQPRSEPPDPGWQAAAHKIAAQAMETLRGREGKRAWHYLEVQRGLTEKVIIQAGLGYIPGSHLEWKTIEGLKVPCGITIPWIADGAIWGIKVRRAAGQQRYQQVRGGNIRGCLYLADTIESGLPIMLTEGEFDALIAKQVGDGVVCATSIGSAAHKHTNPRWFPKFITAPSILVCMDADEAGENAAFHIHGLSQAAKCFRIPLGKDLNEFYQLAGCYAVRNWINEIVGQDEK